MRFVLGPHFFLEAGSPKCRQPFSRRQIIEMNMGVNSNQKDVLRVLHNIKNGVRPGSAEMQMQYLLRF